MSITVHPQPPQVRLRDTSVLSFVCNDLSRKIKKKPQTTTKINGLNTANRVASFPLSVVWGTQSALQKCTEVVSCGCLCSAAAACTLHSGFTGSEIRVCKCPYASSPSTVSEDSRAGKEVKANISAERNKCWVLISWEFDTNSDWKVFTLGMMPCNGSLRCSMIASKGGEGLRKFKDDSSSLCQFD